jgi:hypothetical protein
MIVENKFLYTRVIESKDKSSSELTFAGAMLAVIVTTVVIVGAALAVFSVLTHFGITF